MSDLLTPQPATDATGFLPGPLGLRLDEDALPLAAIAGPPHLLDPLVPMGRVLHDGTRLMLRFAPDEVWISGAAPAGPWQPVDIGHGMTHLRLRGVEALHFLAHFTTADLHSAPIREARAVRTRLNHFDCAFWWSNTRDMHILTDRSLAQSLTDHLRALAHRHTLADTALVSRPVAPNAPDRRG